MVELQRKIGAAFLLALSALGMEKRADAISAEKGLTPTPAAPTACVNPNALGGAALPAAGAAEPGDTARPDLRVESPNLRKILSGKLNSYRPEDGQPDEAVQEFQQLMIDRGCQLGPEGASGVFHSSFCKELEDYIYSRRLGCCVPLSITQNALVSLLEGRPACGEQYWRAFCGRAWVGLLPPDLREGVEKQYRAWDSDEVGQKILERILDSENLADFSEIDREAVLQLIAGNNTRVKACLAVALTAKPFEPTKVFLLSDAGEGQGALQLLRTLTAPGCSPGDEGLRATLAARISDALAGFTRPVTPEQFRISAELAPLKRQNWFQQAPSEWRELFSLYLQFIPADEAESLRKFLALETFTKLKDPHRRFQAVNLFVLCPYDSRKILLKACQPGGRSGARPVVMLRDSRGSTILEHLGEIASGNLDERLVSSKGAIVETILSHLADPYLVHQGNHQTCSVVASVNFRECLKDPAELIRIVTDLLGPAGKTILRDGTELVRVDDSVSEDQSGRSTDERVLQAALMQRGDGPSRSYSNARDAHQNISTGAWDKLPGLTADENAAVMRAVTGRRCQSITPVAESALRKLTAAEGMNVVALRWRDSTVEEYQATGEKSRYHAVNLLRVDWEKKLVYYRNPQGPSAGRNGAWLDEPRRLLVDADRGIEAMTLPEFTSRAQSAILMETRSPGPVVCVSLVVGGLAAFKLLLMHRRKQTAAPDDHRAEDKRRWK